VQELLYAGSFRRFEYPDGPACVYPVERRDRGLFPDDAHQVHHRVTTIRRSLQALRLRDVTFHDLDALLRELFRRISFPHQRSQAVSALDGALRHVTAYESRRPGEQNG
jgi:hypothetical protein